MHVGPGGIITFRCPRAWATDPIAIEGWTLYRWWDQGQLGNRDELPPVTVDIIDILDISYGIAQRADDDRKEAARKRKAGGGAHGVG